jgi:hypothetical protein
MPTPCSIRGRQRIQAQHYISSRFACSESYAFYFKKKEPGTKLHKLKVSMLKKKV